MPEQNEVLWRGVRPTDPEEVLTRYEPPYGATATFQTGTVVNGWLTIYTVPSDTKLFITSWAVSGYPFAGAGVGQMVLKNSGGSIVLRFIRLACLNGDGKAFGLTLPIALECPEGYYIQIESTNANFETGAHVVGYLRDV